jgi:hypothetical protein
VRSRVNTIRTFGKDSPVTVHWVVHSTGFRVRRGLRRGVVERVVIDPATGLAAYLVVRYRFRPFRRRVAPEAVEAVVPVKRVLVVRPPRRARRSARALGRGTRRAGLAVAVAGGAAARRGRVGLGATGRGASTAARATGRGANATAHATVTAGRASGRASVATGRTVGRASVVAGLATAGLARRTTPVVERAGSAAARAAHALGGWADRGLLLFARRAYVLARPLATAADRSAAWLLRAARRIPTPHASVPSMTALRRRFALPAGRWLGQVRNRGEQDRSGLRVVRLVEHEEPGGAQERTEHPRVPSEIEDAVEPAGEPEEVRRPLRSPARGRR